MRVGEALSVCLRYAWIAVLALAVGADASHAASAARRVDAVFPKEPMPPPPAEGVAVTMLFQPAGFGIRDASFPSARVGYAIGDEGAIIKTVDGGEHWQMLPGAGEPLRAVDFVDERTGYAVGGCNNDRCGGLKTALLRTSDGGETWTASAVDVAAEASDVFFVTPSRGFVAGPGFLLGTSDGGAHWETVLRPNAGLRAVQFANDSIGYVLAGRDLLLRTHDGGRSWREVALGHGAQADAMAVTRNDGVYLGGTSWFVNPADRAAPIPVSQVPLNLQISAIAFADEKLGFVAGTFGAYQRERGIVLITRDAGKTWALVADDPSLRHPVALEIPDRDSIFVVSALGIALIRVTGAGGQSAPFSAIDFASLSFTRGRPRGGCTDFASRQWPLPACDRVSGAAVAFSCDRAASIAPSTAPETGVAVKVVALEKAGHLFAFDSAGYAFRSTDAGCTWQEHGRLEWGDVLRAGSESAYVWNRRALFAIDAKGVRQRTTPSDAMLVGVGVDRGNTKRLRAADETGRLWDSEDGGASWRARGALPIERATHVRRASFDATNLDHAVLVTAVGKDAAQLTLDGGMSWQEAIAPDEMLQGLYDIVISPVDGNVVWLTNYRGNVMMSRDGGRSFRLPFGHDGFHAFWLTADPKDADVVHASSLGQHQTANAALRTVDRWALPDGVHSVALAPGEPRLWYLGLQRHAR